jgi:glutaredoxin
MLSKFQLVQAATAVGIAIGTISTPVSSVQANPQQTSFAAPSAPNHTSKPRRYGRNIALGSKIDTVSGAAETALVEHLITKGVKFYGAYWCSHCQSQKSLFGAVAATKLPYVECADGTENSQRQLCKEKDIKMFPTWVIDGKYFTGSKDLKEIAELTGYKGPKNFKYKK